VDLSSIRSNLNAVQRYRTDGRDQRYADDPAAGDGAQRGAPIVCLSIGRESPN